MVGGYGQKLRASVYCVEQARKILMNGIKGFLEKSKRRKRNRRRRIHNTAWESSSGRRVNSKESTTTEKSEKHKEVSGGKSNKELKTRAVLFLEEGEGATP